MGIGDTFSGIFFAVFDTNTFVIRCTSKSVNNDITVTERVKARTVVLYLK